jgi:Tol biopolymer transport system component
MASALSAAHRAGIVHRDIKPENIMLRPDGYVKVLDFGLAKLTQQEDRPSKPNETDKTETSSGLVMGTVKYMSPEQAQGLQVDQRSDIFSFGVVLYEMLAGRAPFEGETTSELIHAIRKKEPPPLTSERDELKRLVYRALTKKKEERYQTIQELLVDLKSLKEDKAASGGGGRMESATTPGFGLSTSAAVAVSTVSTFESVVSGIKRHKTSAAFILASLALAGVSLTFSLNRLSGKLRAPSREMKITRIPNTDRIAHVAISANGEYMACAETGPAAKPSFNQSLWVLEVATNHRGQIMPPAEVDYGGLTYSRDGRDIYYVSNEVLYRIPAGGGEATKVLLDVAGPISFAPDGTQFAFVRGLGEKENALAVANVDGSGERVLTTRKLPEFVDPQGPAWSPDGNLIVCATGVIAKNQQRTLIGFDLATGKEKWVTDQKWDEFGDRTVWLPDGSGLMVPESGGQIWEVSYPKGEAHKVTNDPNYGYSHLGLTADGRNLVALQSAERRSLWLVPNGDPSAATPITSGEHDAYGKVRWTPEGRILYNSDANIWIMNGDGTNPVQLTKNAGVNMQPEPSPDGRYIIFSSNRANLGAYNLWRMDIDGSNPVLITQGGGEGQPVCSPDGRWVVYSKGGPNTGPRQKTLWKVTMEGGEPVQLSDRPSSGAAISPDGALIACWYAQDSASPRKLALIPFAGGSPIKIFDAPMSPITAVGWNPDGRAINYIRTSQFVSNIWSQPVSGGPPQQLTRFTSERIINFDWSRDGQLLCSRGHSAQDVVLINNFR